MSDFYDKEFYQGQRDGSSRSAMKVIPYIIKFIQPASVLDIGCGVGTWLSVFKNDFNVNDISGIDGDYVD